MSTNAVTFATGDRLVLDIQWPASNCANTTLSYDSTSTPSQVTVATIVPEALGGLLLAAPGVPLLIAWRRRRRKGTA